jgi:hypothetical protein
MMKPVFLVIEATLNRVAAPHMSRTRSFEEAADSFAGWFCECCVAGAEWFGNMKLLDNTREGGTL